MTILNFVNSSLKKTRIGYGYAAEYEIDIMKLEIITWYEQQKEEKSINNAENKIDHSKK